MGIIDFINEIRKIPYKGIESRAQPSVPCRPPSLIPYKGIERLYGKFGQRVRELKDPI